MCEVESREMGEGEERREIEKSDLRKKGEESWRKEERDQRRR